VAEVEEILEENGENGETTISPENTSEEENPVQP
jgi:hypothetical protein